MGKFVLTGIGHPLRTELKPGCNTIGRNPSNDVRVQDASVSNFHCELIVSEDSVIVRDLGSTNGTYIDQRQISQDVLRPGEILRLGDAEFRLETDRMQDAARIAIPSLSAPVTVPTTSVCLPDGSSACVNHLNAQAVYQCSSCERTLCEECVRVLSRPGGKMLVFCSVCNGQCALIEAQAKAKTKKKAESFFGRLAKTLRIHLKR